MKIKLIIKNHLEDEIYYDHYSWKTRKIEKIRRIAPYDETKWNNNHVYEFDSLKEAKDFIDSCDIDFTNEYEKTFFGSFNWEVIRTDYSISSDEDNLLILDISSVEDCALPEC